MTYGILPLGFLSLASCSSLVPTESNDIKIKGTIKDGRYFSPDQNFSCAVPTLAWPDAAIEDNPERASRGGTVKFEDEYGRLFRVDWYKIPDDVQQHLSADYKDMFDRVLDAQMENFHYVYPQAKLEARETFGENTNSTLFADVRIPNGSTLVDNGERYDCSRGLFIFVRNKWAYSVSIQDVYVDSTNLVDISLGGNDPFHASRPTVEEREADLKPRLKDFLKGFEFE